MWKGIPETDQQILQMMNDNDLSTMCQTSQYFNSLCQDENFWMNRSMLKLSPVIPPNINPDNYLSNFKGVQSWREYYTGLQGLRNDLFRGFLILLANPHRSDIRYVLRDQLNKLTAYQIGPRIMTGHNRPIRIKPEYFTYLFNYVPYGDTRYVDIFQRLEQAYPNSPDLDMLEDNLMVVINQILV